MSIARLPFTGGHCYACDAAAVGLRDRRPEGGDIEPACKRHADPTIASFEACLYCLDPVRKGSIKVDDQHAHASCHRRAS